MASLCPDVVGVCFGPDLPIVRLLWCWDSYTATHMIWHPLKVAENSTTAYIVRLQVQILRPVLPLWKTPLFLWANVCSSLPFSLFSLVRDLLSVFVPGTNQNSHWIRLTNILFWIVASVFARDIDLNFCFLEWFSWF